MHRLMSYDLKRNRGLKPTNRPSFVGLSRVKSKTRKDLARWDSETVA